MTRSPARVRALVRCAGAAALLLLWPASIHRAAAASFERLEVGRQDVAIFLMTGDIVGGETVALERQISQLPATVPVAVVLSSRGGSVAEGVKLGTFFYRAKIPTFVLGFGGGCHSACALAFLGGRDRLTGKHARFKMTNGALGFHQFKPVATDEEKKRVYTKADMDARAHQARVITFILLKYLTEIHDDVTKLHLMLRAPAEKINLVSNEDAVALGIHVMSEDGADFIEASQILDRVKLR